MTRVDSAPHCPAMSGDMATLFISSGPLPIAFGDRED